MISRFCGAVIALVMTGCALPEPPIRATAIQYNHIVADTNNELLLLNILRAGDGYPMYFTALSDLRGSMTVDVSGGISQSVNGRDLTVEDSLDKDRLFSGLSRTVSRGVDTITPSLSAKLSASPSFNYAVLDTQDFYNGILTSIPESTIIHLLDQGWRSELLAPLVIESVEVDGVEVQSESIFECYQMFGVNLKTPDVYIGPLDKLVDAQAVDFSRLDWEKLKIEDGNLWLAGPTRRKLVMALKLECELADAIKPVEDIAQLNLSGSGLLYNFGQKSEDLFSGSTESVRKQIEDQLKTFRAPPKKDVPTEQTILQGGEDVTSPEQTEATLDDPPKPLPNTRVKLRSTQGVIYAVGERVREIIDPGKLPRNVAIRFNLLCGPGIEYAVSTEYNRKRCGIPYDDREDSLKTLALLNQLINLQKSSKDKPSTQQVTVVE